MSASAPEKSSGRVVPETITRLQAGAGPAFAMLAGMQLELFTPLAEGPMTAAELAGKIGVAEDRLSRLLYALVAANLLEIHEDRFVNTREASAFLVKGRAGYIGSLHELLSQLWTADLLTAQSIRTGEAAALHDFAAMSDAEMATMLRGMHASAVAAGRELLRRFDFSACRSVVDVGGGSGGLVAALCEAFPDLSGALFELPRTAVLAAPILAETPGGARVSIEPGDILSAPPRGTYDAAVVRALAQTLSPEDAGRAIANAAAALRPGGTIYVMGGGVLDNDRLNPHAAVFWNVTFMNLYSGGGSYTEAQHAAWLAAAGCGAPHRTTLANGGGIIRATKLG
jgi:SAM-dependent methyltransferase